MKKLISSILVICILSILMPVKSSAAEAQKVQLTGSELTTLNSVDNSQLDNVSAEGKGAEVAGTILMVAVYVFLISIIVTGAVALASS